MLKELNTVAEVLLKRPVATYARISAINRENFSFFVDALQK